MASFTFPWPASLQYLPKNVRILIGSLVCVNAVIWLAVALPILITHPVLTAPAALSYTLGLRHGLDADHIAAIDLTTRRLIASGQRPASVGTFFSLGHSTVVVITCIVVAATSGALRKRFDGFSRVGNIIGTAVSAVFLVALSIGNAWVLYRLIRRLRKVLAANSDEEIGDPDTDDGAPATAGDQFAVEGGGVLTKVFGKLFKAIDRPWKLYPLGFVFGLGFDTSSEIAILGISSLQAVKGTNLWLILIFPVLFTAGMCLVDTTDGGLMLSLYTSKVFSRDPVAILYYQIVLTGITVTVSAFIGIIQVLSLVQNAADPQGRFWDGVGAIGDHFDIIGGCICGLFLVVGLGSVIAYRPWRRYLDRRDAARAEARAAAAGPSGNVPSSASSTAGVTPAPVPTTPLLADGKKGTGAHTVTQL